MSHKLDILIRNDKYSADCCSYIKCLVLLKQNKTGNSTENTTSKVLNVKCTCPYSEFKAAM